LSPWLKLKNFLHASNKEPKAVKKLAKTGTREKKE